MKKKAFLVLLISLFVISGTVFATENGMFQGFKIINLKVDGKDIKGDTPAINFNDRTMVPVRFVSDVLGTTVGFDDKTNTVTITSKKQEPNLQKTSTLNYNDGSIYEGEVLNNQPNGYGKLTFSNKDGIEGRFVNGLANGLEKYSYANGDILIGEYENGKLNGPVTVYFNNGTITNTTYKDGLDVGNNQGNNQGNNIDNNASYSQSLKDDEIAKIKANYDSLIAGYNSKEAQIKQDYQSQIDQANSNSVLLKSQTTDRQSLLGIQTNLENQLNSINQQEQNEISKIEALKAKALSNEQTDIQNIQSIN